MYPYQYPAPVVNPSVPYVGPLPSLQNGFMILIQGFVPPDVGRFHINLSNGAGVDTQVEVALHFNPRFEGINQVVRNSYLRGSWGQEERNGAFPLKAGNPFEAIIMVQNECFKIAINGTHFCEYAHRSPKEKITHLVIQGNVQLQTIRYQTQDNNQPSYGVPPAGAYQQPPAGAYQQPSAGTYQQPSAGTYQQPPAGAFVPPGGPYLPPYGFVPPACQTGYAPPGQGPAPVWGGVANMPSYPASPSMPNGAGYFSVPYKCLIPGGFTPGKRIHVVATPKSANPDRFAFDLTTAEPGSHNADIAFHFNPRFREGVEVRNTLRHGRWENEERVQSYFPFQLGMKFEAVILCEVDYIKVSVNNQHFVEYKHRYQPLTSINWFHFHGDIESIHSVQII